MMRNGDHYLPIRRNDELVNTNVLYYGSSNPASSTITDQYTANATLINDLNTAAGCNVFVDALSVDVIEPNASMMFIKDSFCADSYDFSSFCGRTIYVFMSADRGWSTGGTFKNYSASTSIRYFRSDMSGLVLDGSCTTIDYSYDANLLTNHTDGDYVTFDATPTASYGGSCSPPVGALPITLTNFKAILVGREVICEWQTVAEINNNFFTIEKSVDGLFFKEVGVINGAGNSTIPLSYNLVDYNPYNGISYYRLKQTDYNGDFTYSVPVAVNNNLGGTDAFRIIEVNSVINPYYFVKSKYYPVNIQVFDMFGRIVKTLSVNSETESFRLVQIKGTYILNAKNGFESVTSKTVKTE